MQFHHAVPLHIYAYIPHIFLRIRRPSRATNIFLLRRKRSSGEGFAKIPRTNYQTLHRTELAQSCPQDIATPTLRAKRVRSVTAPPRANPRLAGRVRCVCVCGGRKHCAQSIIVVMAGTLRVHCHRNGPPEELSGVLCAFCLTYAHTDSSSPSFVSAFASTGGRCRAIVRRTRISASDVSVPGIIQMDNTPCVVVAVVAVVVRPAETIAAAARNPLPPPLYINMYLIGPKQANGGCRFALHNPVRVSPQFHHCYTPTHGEDIFTPRRAAR